ncbi:MAG: N-acetyltransferase [Deinococcus sp.]|nr:N-acetyltransferase [Deinococcus sp.]
MAEAVVSLASLPVEPKPAPQELVRPATIGDARSIHDIIKHHADHGEMLHRPLNILFENIRDFQVIAVNGTVVGCVALHVLWEDLAEVRGLAVHPEHQGRGYGKALVLSTIPEAIRLGIPTLFAWSYRPSFFRQLGFKVTDREHLPPKVWSECLRCSSYPTCGETPLIRPTVLDGAGPAR